MHWFFSLPCRSVAGAQEILSTPPPTPEAPQVRVQEQVVLSDGSVQPVHSLGCGPGVPLPVVSPSPLLPVVSPPPPPPGSPADHPLVSPGMITSLAQPIARLP